MCGESHQLHPGGPTRRLTRASARPTERALLARVAAHSRWAKTPTARPAPPRAPGVPRPLRAGSRPEGCCRGRAARPRRVRPQRLYSRLALKSARARRLRRQADELEDEAADGLIDSGFIAEGGAA
ncbi:hypothetical protein NKG94_23945 [Micromonospora sp. M12]